MVVDGLVHGFVHPFTAAISFGVTRGRHLQFDAREFVEGSPEFGGEERVSVRDEVEHQAVLTVPLVEEYYCYLGGGVCGVGTGDAYVGTKGVGHGEDGVLPILFWEWTDEIQGDCVEAVVWYWQRV
jgi:hypothetical protein